MLKYVKWKVRNNAGLYKVVGLRTSQDISGWTAVGYLYASADPTTALATLTVALDNTAKTMTVSLPKTDVATLGVGDYNLTVLVRPGLAYGVEFIGGTLEVEQGGPAWT